MHTAIDNAAPPAAAEARTDAWFDRLDDLSGVHASALFLQRIPIAFARDHRVLGLAGDDHAELRVAVADDRQWPALDIVARYLGRPVRPVIAPAEQIVAAIGRLYQQRGSETQAFVQELDRTAVLEEVRHLEGREDLLNTAGRAPVIKLVNLVLFEAVQQQASDVHLQPYEDRLVVRMRIQDEMISRVKVMGRMNIAEKRLPQDGRATVQIGDRLIDLRLSAVPASHGERVVIRLLDKSARLYTLQDLGMHPAALTSFKRLIAHEHGLVLVTGPTGSGKSTTLYAALQQINSKQRNIITLEDPIEYQIDGVSQRPAQRAPAGSGHHHDRRDPRSRNRRDGDPVGSHRPPGLLHAPHQ
jgi:general secretion pathway protein E